MHIQSSKGYIVVWLLILIISHIRIILIITTILVFTVLVLILINSKVEINVYF